MHNNTVDSAMGDIKKQLETYGFDIFHLFDIASYNQLITSHAALKPLPTFDREKTAAYLIGNTRALWPQFLSEYKSDKTLQANCAPLDTYTERSVTKAIKQAPTEYTLRFGHHSGEDFVSMRHAAEASSLAQNSPAGLAFHPEYGLWFAMRAILICDQAPETHINEKAFFPCPTCKAPCKDVLDDLMEKSGNDWRKTSWQQRLAIREACPEAQQHQYSDHQIEYHYSQNKDILI